MLKDDRIKDRNWWDEYFEEGGGWERNGGRLQTRIFAEYFTDLIRLDPTGVFSILDVGCALGDALKHFAAVYPRATLYGIDFSATAIRRCKNEIGTAADVSVCDLAEIGRHYDVIYCSNTLEHFPDFETKARHLARHCSRLCVLVPYNEMGCDGKPLTPDPGQQHQRTFLRDSLDFLVREGLAHSSTTYVFSCPGAWGWSHSQRLFQEVKNLARPLLGRHRLSPPRQILFDIAIS
jgi:SAM-dependent methyltransferase